VPLITGGTLGLKQRETKVWEDQDVQRSKLVPVIVIIIIALFGCCYLIFLVINSSCELSYSAVQPTGIRQPDLQYLCIVPLKNQLITANRNGECRVWNTASCRLVKSIIAGCAAKATVSLGS